MALVRATCSDCGDVEMSSNELSVRICLDTDEATYLFRCPLCRMTEVKSADTYVVEILSQAGVDTTSWRLPAELRERRGGGSAINHDDLLDFHTLVTNDDRLHQALLGADGRA